jgi:SAM-dependent methyltransferase
VFDCTTDRYDALYARWLERPGDLLDLVGYRPGMKLLDLCGGTGAVTKEALRRGASPDTVTLYDLNPRLDPARGVRQVVGEAESYPVGFFAAEAETFDVVVCRQAVAYLDLPVAFAGVWALLKPGGKLAFNGFVRPRWALRSYEHDGASFVEASGYLGSFVGHLQWRRGFRGGMDASLFRWHREEDVRAALRGFDVDVRRSERGLRWVCTKISR